MARTINTEKTKKKSKVKIFLIVLLILLIIASGVFLVWKFVLDKEETGTAVEIKELDNLSDYSYVLTDRDSDYYRSEFEELKKIVNVDEVDEEAYAVQVGRMFIIDLYTMNTKVNKYDIGGIEFIHVDAKESYEKKVMDTLYSQLLDDTYGDRKQVLPEVNSLETISTEKITYSVLGNDQTCYLTKFNVGYVSDLKYDSKQSVVVCQENDSIKWGVVDFQPTFTPTYDTKKEQ